MNHCTSNIEPRTKLNVAPGVEAFQRRENAMSHEPTAGAGK